MKAYIAGKLWEKSEQERLLDLAKICEGLGLETYVPHRDGGLARSIKDVPQIFKSDITDSLPNCQLLIADLDGLHVGSGTAFEIGYAYAKGIPVIGIKTDESPEDALDYLSPMILGSIKIVNSKEKLIEEIKSLIDQES